MDAIAAAPDGTVIVAGVRYTAARIGRIEFNSLGGANLTVTASPNTVARMRADVAGGYYAVRELVAGATRTLALVHADTLLSTRTNIEQISGASLQAAFAFDATNSASEALLFMTSPQVSVASIALPVPVVAF